MKKLSTKIGESKSKLVTEAKTALMPGTTSVAMGGLITDKVDKMNSYKEGFDKAFEAATELVKIFPKFAQALEKALPGIPLAIGIMLPNDISLSSGAYIYPLKSIDPGSDWYGRDSDYETDLEEYSSEIDKVANKFGFESTRYSRTNNGVECDFRWYSDHS